MNNTGEQTDVLIVGAGPTGLILAHELLRRGIRCRMIERRPTPSGSTRAFTLHARTMEMFDHMGLAPQIEELREICPGNRFHFKELALAPEQMPVLDFTRLPNTRYNYYGKVNQNDLDRALREGLAAKYSFYPEFGVEFVSSTQNREDVCATVKHTHRADRLEQLTAHWLIGADGAQSAVRAALGSAFEQHGQIMTMSMIDAALTGYCGDRAWVNYYVSEKGFMLVTGLPGDRFRVYLAGELEQFLKDRTPQEAFQMGLDFFDTGARIERLDWSSSWEVRKIIGDTYFVGRTILCGDATHVHSPAGGQGMNACMQDAFNLGWKLALLIQGRTNEDILTTYPTERRPIAEQVTAGADRMHQILFNATVPVAERFQLTQNPHWHDEAILRISALSHHYRGVDGVVAGLTLTEEAVHPGDRAPDCNLSAEPPRQRLYDLLRHPGFTCVLSPGADPTAEEHCRRLNDQLNSRFGKQVKCVVISPHPVSGFDYDHMGLDRTGETDRLYGAHKSGHIVLVRPDLYVGFRGSLGAADALIAYLGNWLKPVEGKQQ